MKYCRRSARIVTSPISAKAAEADEGVFDTSVLVPVFYGDHVHHQASLALFIQFDKSTGCSGAHCLVEARFRARMDGHSIREFEQRILRMISAVCRRITGWTGWL
jgi:predicted nucleic acid-binding protein